jgi:hypothetical protein
MTTLRWLFALPVILLVIDQFIRARRAHDVAEVEVARSISAVRPTRITIILLLTIRLLAWTAALLLSYKSELMIPRCLVMLAPLLIIALGLWLERPRVGLMVSLKYATIFTLLATYLISDYLLARTPRSNARELAAIVEPLSRPSDLLVIAPEWLASSVNRYFKPQIEQIDYPNLGREGAVDFAGVRDRLVDDNATARAQAKIAAAHRDGRRIWVIMGRENAVNIPPNLLPELLTSDNFGMVATGRIGQLRAQLDSLYGAADTTIVPKTRTPQYEDLRAFLFTPHKWIR